MRSTLYCVYCKQHLTKKNEREIITLYHTECPGCFETVDLWETRSTVLPEYESYLDIDECQKKQWWHVSSMPDWLRKWDHKESSVAHVGSKESALARKSQLGLKEYYLYKVGFDYYARWYEEVLQEDTPYYDAVNNPFVVKTRKRPAGFKKNIYRYINKFEKPGSISVMTHPDNIIIYDVKKVKVRNVRQNRS